MNSWSNLAKIVYKRTYARQDSGKLENWEDTVERVISGNIKDHNVNQEEISKLKYYMLNRKGMPAGRGLWFSGAPAHKKLGGAALNNCWFVTLDDWENFVLAQDLLMLGGGVGASVEHRYVSKLPNIKKNILIEHKNTKDADFIIPDSREGWNEIIRRILESFFITGKSFTYSTVCIRGSGELIKGFGGRSSGPFPLVTCISKIIGILLARSGKHIRPVDAMDIICSIGEMVVSGNIRRSAILILGDCWDKEYLISKRWDLGSIPTERAMANLSVVCNDVDDLHPLFWRTYESGEPFGIVNRYNIQKYGRIGEEKEDFAQGVNPCSEATLENGEPCNLQEIFLPHLEDEKEFIDVARIMHRYGKRITCEKFHNSLNEEVVKRNRRIGTGITGCLQSPMYHPEILTNVYNEIQKENVLYSKELGIPESIRTTVVKPSGTLSLLGDVTAGIHASFSKNYIRRVRFAANDPLINTLKTAGHHIEPTVKFDGSLDHNTLVADFYCQTPEGTPIANQDWDLNKQLETLLIAQKYWSDQAVSVTIYYKKEELDYIKSWLKDNLKNLKSISFLCHNDHGFKQAPLEEMTKEKFDELSSKIQPIEFTEINEGNELTGLECEGGVCPIK